jgi:lipopolysaccharide transport system ATP-binding protein
MPIISVENLAKRYRIGAKEQPQKNFRELITDGFTAPIRNLKRLRRLTRFDKNDISNSNQIAGLRGEKSNGEDIIWALKDVSFEVEEGEILGIIGRNGAGKSTLLKLLSRITEPTKGDIKIYGRISSLLEVGTGFHPELTGRDNIFLNGAILGMRKQEIKKKFDEIVAFAETGKFIDTPVKYYSSGMYVRLAFAVAAHLEPDILVVDEVLAVGDVAFQKKCLGKMGDVAKEGRTVLFVSHNMAAINRLCQRVLWIHDGYLRMTGPAEEVVSSYLTAGSVMDGQRFWEEGLANPGVNELRIQAVRIRNGIGEISARVDFRKPVYVEISYRVLKTLPYCRIGFLIVTVHGTIVFEAYDVDDERYAGPKHPGTYTIRCEIPGNMLNPGTYVVSINAGIPNVKNLALIHNVLIFDIEDIGTVGSTPYTERKGIIHPRLRWERQEIC